MVKRDIEELINFEELKEILEEGYLANKETILNKNDNGREICIERTQTVDTVLTSFFEQLITQFPEKRDKALFVAVGSYGRKELTPNSDIDTLLIIDDTINEKDEFWRTYTHSLQNIFNTFPNFEGQVMVNYIEDIPSFEHEKFSTILDLRRLHGNIDINKKINQGLKNFCNPLEFILYRITNLEKQKKTYSNCIDNVDLFNVKYGIGGLRHFQAAIAIQNIEDYESALDVYKKTPNDVLDALGVLLKTRSWLAIKKGNIPENPENDKLTYDDLMDYMKHFGNGAFKELLNTRKKIKKYSEKVIYDKLKEGIVIQEGLTYTSDGLILNPRSANKNKNDLFYMLMLNSQKRGLPIAADVYHSFLSNASEFVKPSPAFLDFFSERGSLSSTLSQMLEIDTLGKIIPGFLDLETCLFKKGHRNKHLTRAQKAIERIESLERLGNYKNQDVSNQTNFFVNEFKEYLGQSYESQIALKLALLCKGIPMTLGMSTENYLDKFHETYKEVSSKSINIINFLIDNKELLYNTAQKERLDKEVTVNNLSDKVKDVELLRNLLLFMYADLDHGTPNGFSEVQWENTIDLYKKTNSKLLNKEYRTYNPAYINPDDFKIIEHLPNSFFYSKYAANLPLYAIKVRQLIQKKEPIINIHTTYSDNSSSLVIMSEDMPGLFHRITGALYFSDIDIKQANIYSSKKPYSFVLDFFNVKFENKDKIRDFPEYLKNIITKKEKLDIPPPIDVLDKSFESIDFFKEGNYYRITQKGENKKGVLYSLSGMLYHRIEADIFAIKAHTKRNGEISDVIFFRTKKPQYEVLNTINHIFKK